MASRKSEWLVTAIALELSNDDDDSSSLRQGVHVTTPEERRMGATATDTADPSKNDDTAFREISYVWVPADDSQPMQERSVRVPANYRGDYLVDYLQKEFASGADKVDISLLQQQAQQTLAASPDTPSSVSEASLKQVAQTASVETFTLVHPTPANQFTSIQIYLDEVGMLKRLPLNPRAAAYAERAGFVPAPQFYGNVFLGRVQKKPALVNQSFRLGVDTAPDAPWLSRATTENLEYQTALNETTGRKNARQAAVPGSDGQAQVADGFSWTQTEEELEVVVSIPASINSKDLQVKFRPRDLAVTVAKEPKVSVRLFAQVDVDGCTWTVDRSSGNSDSSGTLVITMEKSDAALWPRMLD